MTSAAPASSAMYIGFSYRMSMTAVPISILDVRAPTAASSGNGDPSWRAKWCTRKYAPSAPTSSAATASSSDWISASEAERTCDGGDAVQWPKDRKPIFFTHASSPTTPRRDLPKGVARATDDEDASAAEPSDSTAGKLPRVGHQCGDLGHTERYARGRPPAASGGPAGVLLPRRQPAQRCTAGEQAGCDEKR